MFPLSRFFHWFVGSRVNNFRQYDKDCCRKVKTFVEIKLLVYLNDGFVQYLQLINVFLQLLAQFFFFNLSTRQLAKKLEGTLAHSFLKTLFYCYNYVLFLVTHFMPLKPQNLIIFPHYCMKLRKSWKTQFSRESFCVLFHASNYMQIKLYNS